MAMKIEKDVANRGLLFKEGTDSYEYEVVHGYRSSSKIKFSIDNKEIPLSPDQAIEVLKVLNEFVTIASFADNTTTRTKPTSMYWGTDLHING